MNQSHQLQQLVRDQERRRAQIGRLQNLGVALTTVTGSVVVAGVGETQRDIPFTVNFIERPSVTFGPELLDSGFTGGRMPSARGVVLSWKKKDYGTGREYTVGATVGVVATGVDGQTLALHWVAVGKAFRNPIESSVEVL